MNHHASVETLRKITFLSKTDDKYLEPLAQMSRELAFQTHDIIFSEHEPAKDAYLVESGEISLVVCTPQAGCRQLGTVGPGELLGWSGVLEQRRVSATAQTLKPTRVVAFDGHELAKFCRENPQFGLEFMLRTARVLTERLYATRIQLLDLAGIHLPEMSLESD